MKEKIKSLTGKAMLKMIKEILERTDVLSNRLRGFGIRKIKIVSGAAPPRFLIFAGNFLAAAGGEMRSDYFQNRASLYFYTLNSKGVFIFRSLW